MKVLRNRYFLLSDLIFLSLACYLSYVLRLERLDLGSHWTGFFFYIGTILLGAPLLFWRVGIYARYWRYASVEEMVLLARTVTLMTVVAGVITVVGSYLLTGTSIVPRSIPFIFLLLALAFTAIPRLIARLGAHYGPLYQGTLPRTKPILIMGAGDAGAMMLRELQHNPRSEMEVIGFLDDDPTKHGMKIYGVQVLGDRSMLTQMARRYNIQQVIIAMPTAPGRSIREVVKSCEQAGVQTRIIPGIYGLLEGTVSINQLREVNIDDLLRRNPIQTNTDALRQFMAGKRIMVTGGGGSIGSELCRQIAQFDPDQLLLLGHGETSVFHICGELKQRFPELNLVPIIADIRDRKRLEAIYQQHRPEIVFHAAAHKHVPLMEENPCEAITNNVLGTRNLVELADAYEVSNFVMISTDKAVNPTSVMGASKRCAERIVHKMARANGRAYVAVRFGNVLGSRGSVVPLFKQQIAAGGPVMVTHPDMRRFFMTIPEAVQLVLQAAVLGSGGEVFVLDMGEPVRIVDLARDLIELSGLRPDEDIEIKFAGIRPGEKLYEELFIKEEQYTRTHHEKIFVVQSATQAEVDRSLEERLNELVDAGCTGQNQDIRRLLKRIVPEYHSPDEEAEKAPLAQAGLLQPEVTHAQGHSNGNAKY
ncbi:MAG: polysaccharide biosynthesis protein [Ardenticatenales bacterium]|nr:polysaccharide biosynthesis protein [Ardenticatenales bacterium]